MKLVLIALSVLLITGCVVQPTQEGMAVRVIDKQSDYNCKFVRTVTGSGALGWTTAHDAEGAMNQISNRAAKAGANAVRVINVDSDMVSSTVVAEALNCEFEDG